jgi:hypothetical protein
MPQPPHASWCECQWCQEALREQDRQAKDKDYAESQGRDYVPPREPGVLVFTGNLSKVRDVLAKEAFGEDPGPELCRSCKKPPQGFIDTASRREWNITRLCQACQDRIFVDPDEDSPAA